jgi:hypothetical protein
MFRHIIHAIIRWTTHTGKWRESKLFYNVNLGLVALTIYTATVTKEVCAYSLKDFQWSLYFINTKKCLCAVQWGSVQNIILFERYVKFSCCPKFSHPILGYFSRRQFLKLRAQGFVLVYKMCFNASIYCGTIRSHNKFSSFHFLIKYGLNLRPYYI